MGFYNPYSTNVREVRLDLGTGGITSGKRLEWDHSCADSVEMDAIKILQFSEEEAACI